MITLKYKDKTVDMPHLLGLDYNLYKLLKATSLTAKKIKAESDEDKKGELSLEATQMTEEAIDLLIELYPQYRKFSKGFSIMEHMRSIQSLQKAANQHDMAAEAEGDFLVKPAL